MSEPNFFSEVSSEKKLMKTWCNKQSLASLHFKHANKFVVIKFTASVSTLFYQLKWGTDGLCLCVSDSKSSEG